MKVSYKLVGGGGYVLLCDETTGATPLEEFVPSFAPQVQREQLAQSTSEFRANRGNVAIQFPLVWNQQYASRALAKAGVRAVSDALLLGNAKFHLQVIQDSDTDYYPNAVAVDYHPKLNGVSVQHSLTVVSDAPTTTAP